MLCSGKMANQPIWEISEGLAWNTPIAINNQGTVVGFANLSGDENAPENPAAFVWTPSQ